MQISATNIPLEKIGLNCLDCLRGNYHQNIIQLTLLLGKSCCNYTFPLTETTLKFNYPSLRSRRLEVVGEKEKGRARGRHARMRERLPGRPPKIVSRPNLITWQPLCDLSKVLTEND